MIAVYPLLYQVSANRHEFWEKYQPYFDLFTNVHDAAQCYRIKSNICSLNKGFANSLSR